MKNIYLIVGCSGSGKTTITEYLGQKYHLHSIQSYTTRAKRSKDETGHIFVTDKEFDELQNICAFTEFNGNRYCSTVEQVENNDLYVIDPKGVEYFRKNYNGNKSIKIIYIDSPVTTLYERMKNRAERNGMQYIEAVNASLDRIKNDVSEFYDYIHNRVHIDYSVINNEGVSIEILGNMIYDFIMQCESESEINASH